MAIGLFLDLSLPIYITSYKLVGISLVYSEYYLICLPVKCLTGLDYRCFTPPTTIFHLYQCIQFWGNWSTRRQPSISNLNLIHIQNWVTLIGKNINRDAIVSLLMSVLYSYYPPCARHIQAVVTIRLYGYMHTNTTSKKKDEIRKKYYWKKTC
jgi:hypothetical protein